jgi:hypothetical protein
MFNRIHHGSQFKADLYIASCDPLHSWALTTISFRLRSGGARSSRRCVALRKSNEIDPT